MDKIIAAKELSLSYSSSETIINKVSFSVDAGSFVFVTAFSASIRQTSILTYRVDSNSQVNMKDVSKDKCPMIISPFSSP